MHSRKSAIFQMVDLLSFFFRIIQSLEQHQQLLTLLHTYERMKCRHIIKPRQRCRSENVCWNMLQSDICVQVLTRTVYHHFGSSHLWFNPLLIWDATQNSGTQRLLTYGVPSVPPYLGFRRLRVNLVREMFWRPPSWIIKPVQLFMIERWKLIRASNEGQKVEWSEVRDL